MPVGPPVISSRFLARMCTISAKETVIRTKKCPARRSVTNPMRKPAKADTKKEATIQGQKEIPNLTDRRAEV